MSWLLEDPTIVLVAGLIAEALLGAALFITGRGKLLFYMAGVLAVVCGLLLVEHWVVTEREKIEAVIDDLAEAIETGQGDRVVAHIVAENRSLRFKAKNLMKKFHITEVRLLDAPRIELVDKSDPPVAQARFAVLLVAGGLKHPTELEVWFRKQDGHWRVFKYIDHGTAAAFRSGTQSRRKS